MVYRLARAAHAVEHAAVAGLIYPGVSGQFLRHPQHLSDQRLVRLVEIVKRGDVLLGNQQDVRWRLGIDVVERKHLVVLIDLL